MTIATVGTLFPAIPLAIVALNFRYTSLAGLMRNISSQIEMPEVNQSRQNTLNQGEYTGLQILKAALASPYIRILSKLNKPCSGRKNHFHLHHQDLKALEHKNYFQLHLNNFLS